MASVESTLTEEFLTCSICFEIYKDPKTLPCLHSFCKDCIDNLTKKERTNTHPCPICRENFQLSENGAKDLKTNFCIQNLIEFVTSTKEIKKPCSFCSLKGETVDATSRCLTCNDLLCPECADQRHRSTTLTLHHHVVSLADVNAGKYNDEIRSKQHIPCSVHKSEDLRFFCETCDAPVCRDCIVLTHQNHKFVTPSDARKQMERDLKLPLNSLDQKLKSFQNAKETVVSSIEKLENVEKDVKESLEKQIYTIIENVMDSKKKVEEEFDQYVKSKQHSLQQQKKSIQDEKRILEETFLFCSRFLQCGSDIEILSIKTLLRERLSKLQSSNTIETSYVEKVVPPVIQYCNNEGCFKLAEKRTKEESSTSIKQTNLAVPKESVISVSEGTRNKELQKRHVPQTVLDQFSAKDEHDPKRQPNYISVAWVDKSTIAVVDQSNQTLKRISSKGNVASVAVKECMVVSSYKDGLACRTAGKLLHVFNGTLELTKTFSGVSTLLTSSPQSFEVCWICGLQKICTLQKGNVKEIDIHDPNTTTNLSDPMFGHVLENGMFVISDWKKKCVFIIRRSGYVERRKYCGNRSTPGSISSDSDLNIYVCDHERSVVEVFSLSGVTVRTINIGVIAPNPRSIAINQDGHTLIANGKSIIQIN